MWSGASRCGRLQYCFKYFAAFYIKIYIYICPLPYDLLCSFHWHQAWPSDLLWPVECELEWHMPWLSRAIVPSSLCHKTDMSHIWASHSLWMLDWEALGSSASAIRAITGHVRDKPLRFWPCGPDTAWWSWLTAQWRKYSIQVKKALRAHEGLPGDHHGPCALPADMGSDFLICTHLS